MLKTQKIMRRILVLFGVSLLMMTTVQAAEFEEALALPWKAAFHETGNGGWQERWHLDGEKATVETVDGGIEFAAGPKPGENAHMAVLWTRESFRGDVKIRYRYTRTDDAEHSVNILYILATGKGTGPYDNDIMAWAEMRTVPTMSKYFENMNLLHISYAAYGSPQMLAKGIVTPEYVRARRYPIPAGCGFDVTALDPDYFETGLFQPGVPHEITVIKRGPYLMMKAEPEEGKAQYFFWDATGWPPLTEGRIGLRHMAGRSARYENFSVETLADNAPPVKQSWKEMRSVEDVVAAYPERMKSLLDALDLTRPGLETVRGAWAQEDLIGACKALLAYYRSANTVPWWRNPTARANDKLIEKANNYLNDIYLGHDGPGHVPRTANGHLAWGTTGPRMDQGFRSSLNRHSHLSVLMKAFLATGEEVYLNRVDQDLRDWLIAADGRLTPWARSALDPGNRLPHWARVFFGLQEYDAFRPATRLLMLATIPDHAEYLLENPGGGNWVTMTQLGVLSCGIGWPEFKRAEAWNTTAMRKLEANAEETVYPDGAQKELTAAYHMVSLTRYARVAELLEKAGIDVAREFQDTISRMWNYIAWVLRPDGTRPLNNDSGLGSNWQGVLHAAERDGRGDWRYIATGGEEGERPSGPPSRFFPWAGQLVGRSGWDAGAQWYFFDVGPWGLGHQHNDHGHLSITVGDRHLLVDGGRFAYSGPLADRFRTPYARHTRGHNTILIDRGGQNSDEKVAETPHVFGAVKPDYDFAVGRFTAGYESIDDRPVAHTRATVYMRGRGWLVIDRVAASGQHTITPLWHFHPDCTVEAGQTAVQTTDANAINLRLAPVGPLKWSTNMIEGQEEPVPQGWYSVNYGKAEPSACAVYEASMQDTATFAWVMTTGKDTPPTPEVEWLEAPEGVARMRVAWPGGPEQTVTVVMDEAALPYSLLDGRKLYARLLIEEEEKTPEVACGWLLDGQGEVRAAEALPQEAALADLARNLELKPDKTSETETISLSLRNVRFDSTMKVAAKLAADTASAWTLKGDTATDMSLPLGKSATLTWQAEAKPGAPRYPLPQIGITLELPAETDDGEPPRQTVSRVLPVIGRQPPLTVRATADKPTIDGKLDEKPWQVDPDVPVLGRMDLTRSIEPVTQVWTAHDEDHLYLAFRCHEPETGKLKVEAKKRDDKVYLDDSVEIMFDPAGDAKTYYQVIVNTEGVVFDGQAFNNKIDLENLKAAALVHEDHWAVEIAIPWNELGLDGPPKNSTILLGRNRQVTGETEIFQFPISPQGNHQPGSYARMRLQP
jgi:hypothetical protein